jgi:hypothetical protein
MTEMEFVYCAVETESLNKVQVNLNIYRVKNNMTLERKMLYSL